MNLKDRNAKTQAYNLLAGYKPARHEVVMRYLDRLTRRRGLSKETQTNLVTLYRTAQKSPLWAFLLFDRIMVGERVGGVTA